MSNYEEYIDDLERYIYKIYYSDENNVELLEIARECFKCFNGFSEQVTNNVMIINDLFNYNLLKIGLIVYKVNLLIMFMVKRVNHETILTNPE